MSFCAYCGSKLQENAKFCQNCGAPVIGSAATLNGYKDDSVKGENAVVQTEDISYEQPAVAKVKKAKMLFPIIALICIIVGNLSGIAGLAFLYSQLPIVDMILCAVGILFGLLGGILAIVSLIINRRTGSKKAKTLSIVTLVLCLLCFIIIFQMPVI